MTHHAIMIGGKIQPTDRKHPPNPKNKGLPRVSMWRCKKTRTRKSLEWFRPSERNTLRPLVSCIAQSSNVGVDESE
jgi:hypothetical protein